MIVSESVGNIKNLSIFPNNIIRTYLKIGIFVRNQGETESQPAGIPTYVEDLRRGLNAEFGRKDFFEMGSSEKICYSHEIIKSKILAFSEPLNAKQAPVVVI